MVVLVGLLTSEPSPPRDAGHLLSVLAPLQADVTASLLGGCASGQADSGALDAAERALTALRPAAARPATAQISEIHTAIVDALDQCASAQKSALAQGSDRLDPARLAGFGDRLATINRLLAGPS